MIDRDTFFKAKGLFHLAQEHVTKANEYELALSKLLGYEDSYMGHISDNMWEKGKTLEDGLERESIEVEK